MSTDTYQSAKDWAERMERLGVKDAELPQMSNAAERDVCERLGKMLASDRGAACKRLRPYAANVARAAYEFVMQGHPVPDPPDTRISPKDWLRVTVYAIKLVEAWRDTHPPSHHGPPRD